MLPSPKPPRWLRSFSIAILVAALVIWGGVFLQSLGLRTSAVPSSPVASATQTVPTPSPVPGSVPDSAPSLPGMATMPPPAASPSPTINPSPSLSPSPQAQPAATPAVTPAAPAVQTKYGHFPYKENSIQRLVPIGRYYDRSEYLDQEAALAFKQMVQAAKAENVKIVPLSGFRTVVEQQALFQRQIKRQGGPERAAFLSAPPGYSEHHTGYALDVSDGNDPSADLRYIFEETSVYRWLSKNAKSFGFELSFQDNNPLGISFEPWHWRYIGSSRARAIFAPARLAAKLP
jgi:zinc D-Ala-D-Ala carboxypeptidase